MHNSAHVHNMALAGRLSKQHSRQLNWIESWFRNNSRQSCCEFAVNRVYHVVLELFQYIIVKIWPVTLKNIRSDSFIQRHFKWWRLGKYLKLLLLMCFASRTRGGAVWHIFPQSVWRHQNVIRRFFKFGKSLHMPVAPPAGGNSQIFLHRWKSF